LYMDPRGSGVRFNSILSEVALHSGHKN